jgi:fumarylacetoacetase
MSWFAVADDAPFGTSELPYGIIRRADGRVRAAVALGDQVVDLVELAGSLGEDPVSFDQPDLNRFLAAGPEVWRAHRSLLEDLVRQQSGLLRDAALPLAEVELLLPIAVADYVDFYASIHHAGNVGRIFRPDGEPLTPNWRHLPIGYHGRAGTVVVSGTDVVRPVGQRKEPTDPAPVVGPSVRLDIEAELGFVVGVGSALGSRVPVTDYEEHVFGVVLVNDWSARDLQAWEYVPLGPFLGKSFATSISAWVVPLAALDSARCAPPRQTPPPAAYLSGPGTGYELDIEVLLNGETISTCPFSHMYWSPAQMLAHLTVNGAALRTGDLYASGTVSGPEGDELGSLLELTWNGSRPLQLADGPHTFLADGDEVVLRGRAGGVRLGEVRGRVRPAT